MNKKQRLITPYPILLLLLFSTCVVKAQVYVKFYSTGTNNGTSWANEYTNLDSALNKAASGEIWVAAGTYKPSINFQYHAYPVFNITRNIALYGGFKGNESSLSQRNIDNNPTILSGDVGVAGYDQDNSPTVLAITGSIVDSTCIVDGFTITNAYYTNAAGSYQNAAVYIFTDIYDNRNPVLRNCTIKNNFGFYGAGIYVRSAKPLLYNNLITNNTACEGAGIYLDYAGNARVVGNRIVNNKCVGGYTNLSGGGIKVEAYCAPYIYGNLIDNNYAGNSGGGISVETNNNIIIIANNIISNNTSRDGGGVYVDFTATDILNNLVVGNKATNNGGGLYINYSYASRSINNTIVGNSAEGSGGAVYLQDGNMQLTNTIIYSNPTKYGKQFNSTNPNRTDWFPKMYYCDIEDGKQGRTFSNPALIDNI
jgi:parallel beta-helix repeat protein